MGTQSETRLMIGRYGADLKLPEDTDECDEMLEALGMSRYTKTDESDDPDCWAIGFDIPTASLDIPLDSKYIHMAGKFRSHFGVEACIISAIHEY